MSSANTSFGEAQEPLLITALELARLLHVSLRTLWRLNSAGKVPTPVRLGASVRWRSDEVRQWIAEGCPTRKSARE
jgi:predicted DNA-binding transcriptional regulator AlpA